MLIGSTIREHAIPILLREREANPIHYREWLALLNEQGYEVAGKRPDAVFLNQVTRSPVVRATTQSGYYALDFGAIERLQRQLGEQIAELAEISEAPSSVGNFEQKHERQRELSTAIAKTERELNEAKATLQTAEDDTPVVRAA